MAIEKRFPQAQSSLSSSVAATTTHPSEEPQHDKTSWHRPRCGKLPHLVLSGISVAASMLFLRGGMVRRSVPTTTIVAPETWSSKRTDHDQITRLRGDKAESPPIIQGVSNPLPKTISKAPTRKELKQQRNCPAILRKTRPVHSETTWQFMRDAYHQVVDENESTIADVQDSSITSSTTSSTTRGDAFAFRYVVQQAPGGMGRGIFAQEFIPKGQVMYDFRRTAQFRTGDEFRDFLNLLPDDLACDVLMWSYVQDLSTKEEAEEERATLLLSSSSTIPRIHLRIMADLDPGSFCNDGEESGKNMAWQNDTDYFKPAINQRGMRISAPLVALRDINIGEEVLCDYTQFSDAGWSSFGLS